MKAITENLSVILTPKAIYEGIYRGITNYYNNTTKKEEKRNNINPIDAQEIIGW